MAKFHWLAVLVAAGTVSTAHAGDSQPTAIGAAIAPPAWDGFYAGVYASDDITALHVATPGEFSFDGIGGESAFGGALVGFNHRFSNRVVGGAEIDVARSTGGSHFDLSEPPDYFNASVTGEWGASLKGRLGYLVSPDTLFYAFGGGVVAVASYGCTSSVYDCPPRMQETMYGWPLVGLGAETQISSNWRLRYEYEVKFLPTLKFDPIEVRPLSGTANLALIRDFGAASKAAATSYFGYAPRTWAGFHGGVAAGYSMSMTAFGGTEGPYSARFDGLGGGGPVAGVFGGYDWQFGDVVLGADAGYYANGGTLKGTLDGYGSFEMTGHSFYTVTGRAGMVVTPSTMVYALGGWIHADGALNLYDPSGARAEGVSFGRDGQEIGGGIETWLNRNLSVRAEYDYAMFGNMPQTEGINVSSHVGTATLGAVYHFGQ